MRCDKFVVDVSPTKQVTVTLNPDSAREVYVMTPDMATTLAAQLISEAFLARRDHVASQTRGRVRYGSKRKNFGDENWHDKRADDAGWRER